MLRLEIGAQQKRRKPGDASVFKPVLRHVLHRFFKAEKAGSHPRTPRKPNESVQVRQTWCRGGHGQQFPLEIARQVNSLIAVAESGTKGVRRLRSAHTSQHRGRADRAAILHAALDVVAQLRVKNQAFGHADGRDEAIAGLDRRREFLDQRRIKPVAHAAVVGHFHLRGRIDHETIANALLLRALLVDLIQLAPRYLRAIKRFGIDHSHRDGPDRIPVAVDELPEARRLVEMPGHAVLRDALSQRKLFEIGRSRLPLFGVNHRRAQRSGKFCHRFVVVRVGLSRRDQMRRSTQDHRDVVHPNRLAVFASVVAPNLQGVKALEVRLVERGPDFLVVMEKAQADFRVKVEGPFVPSRRRSIHPQPEQLLQPILPITRGGREAFIAGQVAGVENARRHQPAIALEQSPPWPDACRLAVGRFRAVVVNP